MTNSTKFPDIKRTEIDPKAVKKFSSEADFVGLSLELLIETGSWLCVAGNLLPAVTEAWRADNSEKAEGEQGGDEVAKPSVAV